MKVTLDTFYQKVPYHLEAGVEIDEYQSIEVFNFTVSIETIDSGLIDITKHLDEFTRGNLREYIELRAMDIHKHRGGV